MLDFFNKMNLWEKVVRYKNTKESISFRKSFPGRIISQRWRSLLKNYKNFDHANSKVLEMMYRDFMLVIHFNLSRHSVIILME